MKKNVLFLALLAFSILIPLASFAQKAEPPAEPPATPGRQTFYDDPPANYFYIVSKWGIIGLTMFLGLPLGIIAIKHSLTVKSRQYPLSVKLLPCGAVLILIVCVIFGTSEAIDSFEMLATATGSAFKNVAALALSQTLYLPLLGLLGCLEYLIFFIISIVILHSKQKPFFEK